MFDVHPSVHLSFHITWVSLVTSYFVCRHFRAIAWKLLLLWSPFPTPQIHGPHIPMITILFEFMLLCVSSERKLLQYYTQWNWNLLCYIHKYSNILCVHIIQVYKYNNWQQKSPICLRVTLIIYTFVCCCLCTVLLNNKWHGADM